MFRVVDYGADVWCAAGKEKHGDIDEDLLTGTTDSGSYIRLDIHRSRKTVKDINISADIDSIHLDNRQAQGKPAP